MNTERAAPKQSWRRGGVVVFAAAAFLLLSTGGAIVAAPITVPLMFLVSRRHPTTAFRITGALLAGLTVAELVWALTFLEMEEAEPGIWLLPPLAGVVAGVGFAAGTTPGRHRRVTA